jgi:hypothetical protein
MTRSKTKAFKEASNALVLNVSTKSGLKVPLSKDVDEDDYDFVFVGQRIRSGPNRARRM